MYFSEHKSVVEIDENGHIDRNQNEENERQTKIEKHPDCKFFHRINPGRDLIFFLKLVKCKITLLNQMKKSKRSK